MERHRCKLCFKNFANGRALGGHMRSHMLNLYVPPKAEQPSEPLGDETELDSVSSSSEEEVEELELDEDGKELLGYGLRENPKKSIRLVDPEFSAFHDHHQAAGSVVLQDRESETESSRNPVRRRSKRVRKSGNFEQLVDGGGGEFLKTPESKKPKLVKLKTHVELAWVEPEPVSSISDTTPDEDVAYCLMMLSRDKWRKEKELAVEQHDEDDQEQEHEEDYYEQSENDSDHEVKVSKPNKTRAKYRCDTCNKVFKSYQALGGHRASHKKIRLNSHNNNNNGNGNGNAPIQDEDRENVGVVEEKIHECPVCFRVFASGQALGGHKRSHVIGSSATIAATSIAHTGLVHAKPAPKQGEISLIDLNLPAPMEEDEVSQVEHSAVSDGEFVKTH